MESKDKDKDKGMHLTPEQKLEEKKEDVRELPDEKLEDIAGGTTPIISPFS